MMALISRIRTAMARSSMAFIDLGSLRENGYAESFNGKLRDELLNAEVFNLISVPCILLT